MPHTIDIEALCVSPADDDHRLLARILNDAARRVNASGVLRSASSLESALDALRRARFSIVFTEADLCPGSWRDVFDAVQAQADSPLLIVASRLADEELWAEVLNLGGYDVAAKPFDCEEVRLRRGLSHDLFGVAQLPVRSGARGRSGANVFSSTRSRPGPLIADPADARARVTQPPLISQTQAFRLLLLTSDSSFSRYHRQIMSSVPMPASTPPVWTNDTLEPLRQVGDPLADAVIAELFADGGVQAMNALMASFVANEHPAPETLPAPVREYLLVSEDLPAWADPGLIKAGEELFWRFGPRIILILTCYSLPFCYLGRNGVPVLAMTNRLASNPRRRIVETAQMVVDCMAPGGLTTAGGRGRLTIQKVRLMHATIRRLAAAAPTWKPEYGLPVNQEDLAGTLMSFSHIALDGLDKLGIPVADQDRRAYIHCWNVVGRLLGVHDDILPADPAQAKSLADAIAAHQFGPTQQGQDLTKALVDMMAHVLPGDLFDKVPTTMIRFFLGKEWAEWLGVHEGFLAALAAQPIRFFGHVIGDVVEDSKPLADLAETVGRLLLGSIVLVERGGNRPSFAIPTELRQAWGVNWTS